MSALLIAAFFSARVSQSHVDVSQANERQEILGARATSRIQEMIDQRGIDIDSAIRRTANRGRLRIVTVNLDKQELNTGFPESLLSSRSKKSILDLASENGLVLITTPRFEFVGPYEVTMKGDVYRVFIGRLLRREERAPVSWGIALVVSLLVGSCLCLALAYRLSKPLAQLRLASRAFADGDLRSRVQGQANRKDEIGLLAADFNVMADKLNASMQQQQMLLANISHELRTPLTRLQLAAAILYDKASLRADVGNDANVEDITGEQEGVTREYLERIELEITNMDKLISQILRLTRMQNANSGLMATPHTECKEYLLADIFEPLINNLKFEATALNKKVECNNIPTISIMVNQEAIVSGIENILRNAIKFAESHVWITFELTDTRLLLHVDDDGQGLDEKQISRLFEPFFQADTFEAGFSGSGVDKHRTAAGAEHKSNDTGFGLGLAIAHAAVQLHKGSLIAALSTRGGLRFTVSLPFCDKLST